MDAAVQLLRTRGVKALGQPQVARMAGVKQGHLTYYFPRKADLLAAVSERLTGEVAERMLLATQGSPGAPRVLEAIAQLAQDHERSRSLLGLVVESQDDPALRKRLITQTDNMATGLAYALGRPPSDADVELALATLCGVALFELIYESEQGSLRRRGAFIRLLEGLRLPAPKKTRRVTRRR